MRNILAAVVVGLGSLMAAGEAQASWLSEALRNTHVNVNLGPSYGPGYYAVPCAPPPCAVPVYVAPPCGHSIYPVAPVYPSYRDGYRGGYRGDFGGRGGYRGPGGHGHRH